MKILFPNGNTARIPQALPVLSRKEVERFSLKKLKLIGARIEETDLGLEVWFRRAGTYDFIYGRERLDVVVRKAGGAQ